MIINAIMEKCAFMSDVRECHVYWDIWKPLIRENLHLKEGFVYNSMNKISRPSMKLSMIVSHFFYKFSQFIYAVERSQSNLPVQTTLQRTLHDGYYLSIGMQFVKVKQKSVAWKNYRRSNLMIPNHVFINPQKRQSRRLKPQPSDPNSDEKGAELKHEYSIPPWNNTDLLKIQVSHTSMFI